MPHIDPLSFFIGVFIGAFFWSLLGRARPLFDQIRRNAKERNETAKARRTSGLEDNHRRITLRRAQGMHLAASLFALDDILQEPRLLAPPARIEPGEIGLQEDIISQTLPYLPGWSQLAGIYNAPTFTLEQALSGGANIVITGAAGAGKTVALAHLASLAANLKIRLESEAEAIPYLYHVADLQLPYNAATDPINVLTNAAAEFTPLFDLRKLPGFIQRTFQAGQALLLIDGFDELDELNQKHVAAWFAALLQNYPAARIITTGCPSQLNGLISLGFQPLALIGWNQAEISRFAQRWSDLWAQTIALESVDQPRSTHVDSLLLNAWTLTDDRTLTPFELTLKLWGAYAGDSLGPRALDAIAAHLRRVAPSKTPVAALETLAMQSALTSQAVFDPRAAREWVKQYDLGDGDNPSAQSDEEVASFTEDMETPASSRKVRFKRSRDKAPSYGLLSKMAESGLLIAHPNGKMRFLHSILQGYLAGQAIGDYDASQALLAQAEWNGKTVALRYLAARGDASATAERLLKESKAPLHRNLFTIAGWLPEAPKEAAWRNKIFVALLQILQLEGQPLGLRGQAMAAFVASGDVNAAALFRQLLNAASLELLSLAALGSGGMHDVKAIETLDAAMQTSSNSVRRACCLALVAIGTEKALDAVGRALLHGDEELQKAAAEALANDPTEGYAALRDSAAMQDIKVRRAAIHGLARIEQPWALELLQKMQVEDNQWVVRNLAMQYLEQKERLDPRVPQRLPVPSETPWLIEFASKQGMGIPRDNSATETLIAAFCNGDVEERLAALPHLKSNASDSVIDALYAGLYGEDHEVREASFIALEEIAADGIRLPQPAQFGFN